MIVAPAGAGRRHGQPGLAPRRPAGHPGVVGAVIAVKDVAVAGLVARWSRATGAVLRAAGRYTEAIAAHQAAVEAFSGLAAWAGVYGIVPGGGFATIPTGGTRPVIVAPAGAADTADLDWRRAVLLVILAWSARARASPSRTWPSPGWAARSTTWAPRCVRPGGIPRRSLPTRRRWRRSAVWPPGPGVYGIRAGGGLHHPDRRQHPAGDRGRPGESADTADLDWRRAVLLVILHVLGAGAGIAVKDVAVAGLGGALDNLGAALRAAVAPRRSLPTRRRWRRSAASRMCAARL